MMTARDNPEETDRRQSFTAAPPLDSSRGPVLQNDVTSGPPTVQGQGQGQGRFAFAPNNNEPRRRRSADNLYTNQGFYSDWNNRNPLLQRQPQPAQASGSATATGLASTTATNNQTLGVNREVSNVSHLDLPSNLRVTINVPSTSSAGLLQTNQLEHSDSIFILNPPTNQTIRQIQVVSKPNHCQSKIRSYFRNHATISAAPPHIKRKREL